MVVTKVKETSRSDATYNLTVADFETYFVGKQRVLVHNCKKVTKKERRAKVKQERKERKANEPASEGRARYESRGMSPEQRRKFHDDKKQGEGDRPAQQLMEDREDTLRGI